MNLCADQLVVQLVDRARIAAVTWLALDPVASGVAAEAAGLTTTYGTAEEVVRLDPDLVIAGRYTTRTTVALLRRFGYRVMEIDTTDSFDRIEQQILDIAEAVGARERGTQLVAGMRARLTRLDWHTAADTRPRTSESHADARPLATIFGSDGGTQGAGTLIDAVLRASGLRNLAAELGIRGYSQLALEQLIRARPDLVILPTLGDRPMSVGQQLLVHPALLSGTSAARVVHLPAAWTTCGGPLTVAAVEHLRKAIAAP